MSASLFEKLLAAYHECRVKDDRAVVHLCQRAPFLTQFSSNMLSGEFGVFQRVSAGTDSEDR